MKVSECGVGAWVCEYMNGSRKRVQILVLPIVNKGGKTKAERLVPGM